MSDSDNIKLWCWVLGDTHNRVFSVSIKRSTTIHGLKKAIQGRKPPFKDIPADSLDLYKFQLPLEDFNEDDAQSINLEDGQELKPFKDVSFYWMKEPWKVLSVILPRPAATILPSSSLNSNLSPGSAPSWLVEIHHKLWGKRELFGEIFRTANLTEADFIELQCQLEELNPERDSESYVIPSPPTASRHPPSEAVYDDVDDANDAGAVADDAMDIDPGHSSGNTNIHKAHLSDEPTAIFPYAIRYMDLTGLNLKMVYRRLPQLMLFRDEWSSMIDIFNKREQGIDGSTVFTGQPGIGKTCLLYSILILCIITAQPIVFQDKEGRVFIIDDTVHPPTNTTTASEGVKDVLALVDGNGACCQPNQYLFDNPKHRILLTSSPRLSQDRRWLIQMVQSPYAIFVMEPWAREEFVVASLFLHGTDITLKRLQETSFVCGNIPRQCFVSAESPNTILLVKHRIREAIEGATNLSDAVRNVKSGEATHRAFQIRPSKYHSCIIEPISNWALLEMMDVLQKRSKDNAYKLYCAIRGSPDTSSLSRRMFETAFHRFLKTPRTFTIESLDNRSAILEISFPSNTNHLAFGAQENFSGQLASSVENDTSCYLRPLSPIFPSFDSFLYQPETPQPGLSRLIALQVTTAVNHPINIKGLVKVQQSLPPGRDLLKDLRPLTNRKMIIIFVVPDDLAAVFVKQDITDAATAGHWNKKTAQYVLPVSAKEVFEAA